MAVAQRWQYIPSAVASQAEQQDRAQQWGDSQRQALAQVWADNQRAQSAGLLNQYLPPSAPSVDQGLPPDYGTGTDGQIPLAQPSRMGGGFTPDSGLTPDEAAGTSTPPEAPQGLLGDKGFAGADVTKLAPPLPETSAPSASSADPFAPLRPAFDFLKSIPIFGPGQLPELPKPGEPLQDVLASNTNTAIQNASQSPRPMVGPFGGLGINSPEIDPNLFGGDTAAAGKTIGSEVGKVRQAARDAETIGTPNPAVTQRFYHGTGAAFERPSEGRFENGLFGPGYYLTDNPEVASSYADRGRARAEQVGQLRAKAEALIQRGRPGDALLAKQMQDQADALAKQAAPNVRAVSVPADLKLLDAEAPAPSDLVAILEKVNPDAINGVRTGTDLYGAIAEEFGSKADANDWLAANGYDGIRYAGGRRMPIRDSNGKPIEHTAIAVFPDALNKLHNALSGTEAGATVPGLATSLVPQQPGESDEDYRRRQEIGAALTGAGLAIGRTRMTGNAPQANPARNLLARLALGGANVPSRVASTVVPSTVSWINSVLAPVRNTAPEVQRAIAAFANHRLQAAVDAETLGLRAANLLGKENKATAASLYERTGQFLSNPTAEQADFAREWEQFAQQSLDLGHQGGYISGTAENLPGVAYYFPHVFAEDTPQVAPRAARSSLSPRDFFSNPRDFPTLEEAIAAGKTPVDTVSGPVRYYVQHVMNSEAKVQLVTDLKGASPAAIMPYQRGDRLPPGWVPGRALDPVLGGYAFPRPVADVIDNITQPSGLAGSLLRAMATAKETLFSLSGFHLVTELRQAYRSSGFQGIPVIGRSVWNAAVPGAYDTFRLRNADAFSQASSAGVTGLAGEYGPDIGQRLGGGKGLAATAVRAVTGGTAAGGSAYFNAKAAGADEETALQRAAIYGVAGAVAGPTVGKVLSDALWERAVPTLKVLTFQLAKQKASPDAAATFVNQTFGGNNLAAIGRSKTVQDAIRLAVLAPDWWEGWARQLKGVLPGQSTGGLSRAYWARTIAVDGAFMLEGLNLALSGHLTDQNQDGHQFDLELTSLYDRMGWNHTDPKTGQPFRVYSDILGPIRSILEGPSDPGQFLKSHAGIVPGVTADLMSNRDFRGNPIVPPGTPAPVGAAQTVAHATARIAPVGAQSLEQSVRKGEPAPVAAAAAITGFRTSDVSPRQEIGKARSETAAQYRPPGLQKLLQGAGMQSVSPVEPYITIGRDRLPLQLDEWKQYQGEFQKRFEPYIQRFASDDRFVGLPQDEQKNLIEAASRKAREAASETVLKTLDPAGVRRRIVAYRNRGTP